MEQEYLIPEAKPEVLKPEPDSKPNGGNGRPRNARNRRNRELQAAASSQALPLILKVIDAAMNGDMLAARIVLDRVWPKPRSLPVELELPATKTPAELRAAMHDLLARVASGEITTDDGAALISMMKDILSAERESFMPGPMADTTVDIRTAFVDKLVRHIEDTRRRNGQQLEPGE